MRSAGRSRHRAAGVILTLLFVSVSLLAAPGGPGARAQGPQLVVTSYGGAWEQFMRKEILPEFERQTGGKVELAVGLSKDWTANMYAAGMDKAPYDIVITNEIWAAEHRRKGFYAPFPPDKVPNLKDVHPLAKMKDNTGVLFILLPIGIGYRTDLVKTPPRSWKELWKPEYKGKLGLYTITNTAGGIFLMLTGKIWGGDYKKADLAFDKIKELKPFRQTDFSGNMEALLTQGEIHVGVLDIPAVVRLRKGGVKIGYIIPAEGMYMFEQDVNVTKGSRNKDRAFAFVNFLLSPPIQEKWMRQFWATPTNLKVKVPLDLQVDIPIHGEGIRKILQWDWDWYNDNKENFIRRWTREISG
ncbi:MAG: ABC transporter substrate-binding protein [Armatimonadetes bacterium]|nr:ABC transporter substrate-binding protein [Armatimonadota bacterium]